MAVTTPSSGCQVPRPARKAQLPLGWRTSNCTAGRSSCAVDGVFVFGQHISVFLPRRPRVKGLCLRQVFAQTLQAFRPALLRPIAVRAWRDAIVTQGYPRLACLLLERELVLGIEARSIEAD